MDSVSNPIMAPDERALRSDLEGKAFITGVALDYWRLVDAQWPSAMIAVRAAQRSGAPDEVILRFDFNGYPASAPTSTPWDVETSTQLAPERRPAGRRASSLFRRDGWNGGAGLYAPYDRLGFAGHENWGQDHAHLCWKPDYDLTFYLRQVYDVLHDEDYTGV